MPQKTGVENAMELVQYVVGVANAVQYHIPPEGIQKERVLPYPDGRILTVRVPGHKYGQKEPSPNSKVDILLKPMRVDQFGVHTLARMDSAVPEVMELLFYGSEGVKPFAILFPNDGSEELVALATASYLDLVKNAHLSLSGKKSSWSAIDLWQQILAKGQK